jgi:hypothetical protein
VGQIGQLKAQRRGIFAFRQRLDAVIRHAQQQRQTEMLPEKAIVFLSRSMVKSFISFGKFHRRMMSGFQARIFPSC